MNERVSDKVAREYGLNSANGSTLEHIKKYRDPHKTKDAEVKDCPCCGKKMIWYRPFADNYGPYWVHKGWEPRQNTYEKCILWGIQLTFPQEIRSWNKRV